MNREEFEQAYADKYTEGDLSVVRDNRDGEFYVDKHMNSQWKKSIECGICIPSLSAHKLMERYQITYRQSLVLYALIDNFGEAISKDMLCEAAGVSGAGRALSIHISAIRWLVASDFTIKACYGGGGYSIGKNPCNYIS